MSTVPLPVAAKMLGISQRQLQRDIENGAPCARRGRRGAGGAAQLDVAAVAKWRADRDVEQRRAPSRSTAGVGEVSAERIADIVAAATAESFKAASGPHKRPLALELSRAWYRIVSALYAEIGAGTVDRWPLAIRNLASVGGDSGD